MPRPIEAPCLRTSNPSDRIALRGVRLRARLAGMSCRATLEQTFINSEDRAIEAVYTFPLPEGAAVCGFEVLTSDRVLTGVIEETDHAIEKYESAIADGHGAFMAEQDRPDVFTMRVGNLKPRQAATIKLTYVAPLTINDRAIRVAFPTTIAPRYATATGVDDKLEAQIDADALNPPHVLYVPYGLTLEVDIALGRAITSIASPTHAIRSDAIGDGGEYRVTLNGGRAEMDRAVVLEIRTKKEQQPLVEVARGVRAEDQASYLAVTFIPEFDESELTDVVPSETIFLLDCSGSMQGNSIAQAVAALELCLRSLSEGDTFNICRFGSRFEMMSSEALRYNEATLRRAIDYVRDSRDLGGTEIFHPLEKILTTAPRAGSVRNVLVLTDGQVSNEPAVIELARKHRSHNRVFAFGIGPACSEFLVKGLARATGGAAEFIASNERIEEKVLRTFARLASPPVTDVQLDWGDADVQTLAEIPPIFDGDMLSVFGRCAGRLPKNITLRCHTPAGAKQWTLAVPPHAIVDDRGAIATLWARRTIQSLEEVNGVRRTSVSARNAPRVRDQLIAMSKEFNLLSSLTTFIAIEHRTLEERNDGRPALRRVPVLLAAGWGGLLDELAAGGVAALCDSAAGAMPMAAPVRSLDRSMDRTADSFIAPRKRFFGKFRTAFRNHEVDADHSLNPESVLGQEEAKAFHDDLTDLLSLQGADGSFSRGASFDRVLSKNSLTWDRLRQAIDSSNAHDEAISRTIAVLYLLRHSFRDRESLWRRAAFKARRYVANAARVHGDEVDAWVNRVESNLLVKATP